MEQQTFDILKLVESQGRCYVSSDCMEGVLLASYLKYHPDLPRDQLLKWMVQILQELEKFHRCRGNPCYQYVNPYSMTVGKDGRIHLLDLGSAQQQDLRKRLQRRSIRKSFLMPDNQYYQRASLADDIYGIGRTFQYMLASTETVPPIKGQTKRKLRKIIFKCLSQSPDQEAGGRFKKQYHNIREISEQFPRNKQKPERAKKVIFIAAAAASFAAVFFIVKREVFPVSAVSDEVTAGASREDRSAEQKLKFDMAMLYFLEIGDYEKSSELFHDIADHDSLAADYEKLSNCMTDPDHLGQKQMESLLLHIQDLVPDKEDSRYYLSMLKGYSLLDTDSVKEDIIRLGEHCFSLDGWMERDGDHEDEKELRWLMADAYKDEGDAEKAAEQYETLLGLETENRIKEQIYSSLVSVYEESGKTEEAWNTCARGIEEVADSRLLRIQYIRMQCASPETDRQICAQTVKQYLSEIPEIAGEPEFQKLQEEYGIKVEGEEVWVGK